MGAPKDGQLESARGGIAARAAYAVKAAEAEAEGSHRVHDVLGVLCVALAVVTVISLTTESAGIVGQALGEIARALFGTGAVVVPILLTLWGGALFLGKRRIDLSRSVWGSAVLFWAVLGAMARPASGDYFAPDAAAAGGGYAGALLASSLDALFGAGKAVGLGAIGMIGVILILNAPLRAVAQSLAERAKRRARAATTSPPKPAAPKRAVVRLPDRSEKTRSVTTRAKTSEPETLQPNLRTLEVGPKEGYQLPPLSLLAAPEERPTRSPEEMQQNIDTLEGTLEEFGIEANVVEIANGPTVTRYEIQLGPGIRVGRITALADNIAMNMAASHVRVEAPIPGKAAIGVEVPHSKLTPVRLRELCQTKEFLEHPSRLLVALGQDVAGTNRYADLTKMPHLLIGGATNSGKSIGLASIIMSLLMRNTPKDTRLVLIDPKRVELTLFDGIPHLMCPVVRDVKEAPSVLRAVCREMDRRIDLFAEASVRNIDGWNEKASFQDRLPYIVVVIDELADMMVQAAAEVETSICRLAQLARATGIHLVIATQRPSVDVITGTIKANIASRIAFSVSSHIDSRTILDQKGAESLVGKGDMLFLPIDAPKPQRIQGCYVSEKEIEAVCAHWRAQEKPHYVLNPVQVAIEQREAELEEQESDPLWHDTVRWVADRGQASTSMLQRRFAIGFQRASRLLDLMEERGIVGPRDGPRPRDVLISPSDVDQILGRQRSWDEPSLEIAEDRE